MFRFETFVKLAVLTIGFLVSVSSHAQERRDRCDAANIREYHEDEIENWRKEKELAEKDKKPFTKPMPSRSDIEQKLGCDSSDASALLCREAPKEYRDTLRAFSDACSEAGVSSEGKKGHKACSHSIAKCQCTYKSTSAKQKERLGCEIEPVDDEPSGVDKKIGLPSLQQAQQKIEYCPAEAGFDANKFEKNLEKAEARIKEIEKRIQEISKEARRSQKEFNRARSDHNRKVNELVRDYNRIRVDIRKNLQARERQLMDEIQQFQTDLRQQQNEINQLDLQKKAIDLQYQNAVRTLRLQCHKMATETVAQEMIENKKSGGKNVGFKGLLMQAGLAERELWKKRAEKIYRECMNSSHTKEAEVQARKARDLELDKLDGQIRARENERKAVADKIQQKKNSHSCTGGNPSEVCKAQNEALVEMNILQDEHQAEMTRLASELKSLEEENHQALEERQGELEELRKELMTERRRAERLSEILTLQASSGRTSDKEKLKNLNSSYAKFKAAANQLYTCCDKFKSDNCADVEDFLFAIGQIDDKDRKYTVKTSGSSPSSSGALRDHKVNTTNSESRGGVSERNK